MFELRPLPSEGVAIAPIDLPPFELKENLRSTKQIAQLFGSFGDAVVRPRGPPGSPVRIIDTPYDDAIAAAIAAADDAVEALPDEGWDLGQIALLATGRRHPEHKHGVVLAVYGFREPERARRMLYTGLSRARAMLVVAGPRAEIERLGGDAVRHRL